MKIYLYLVDKIVSFSLPKEVDGSYSFDENPDETVKLINIEARDGNWVLYSTGDVNIVNNNNIVGFVNVTSDTFYILRRDGKNYLIYISNISENSVLTYSYDKKINLVGKYEYLNNSQFNEFAKKHNVLLDIKIDYEKVISYASLKKEINAHEVNPVYIKKIDVEK